MAIEKYTIPLLLGNRKEIPTTPACLVTDDIQAYQFEFELKDNDGYDLDLSWVTSASIKMAKSDGEVVIGAIDITDNVFTYDLGTNELASEGYVLATVQLYGGATRITTQIFKFQVIHEIVGESQIPSTSEYTVLTDLIAQVQALYDAGAATVTYVDEQDEATEAAAKAYTDAQIIIAALAANDYTDTGVQEAKNYADAQDIINLASANEYTNAQIELVVGAAGVDLDSLYELANAINNNPDFGTEILAELANKVDKVNGKGLSTEDFTTVLKAQLESLISEQTTLTNHLQIQQIRSNFIDSYARNYKEITKDENDLVSNIQIWVDNTKTELLFSKTFAYIGEVVSEIVTTDHTNNKILTKTIGYPSDTVTTITEVITNGN